MSGQHAGDKIVGKLHHIVSVPDKRAALPFGQFPARLKADSLFEPRRQYVFLSVSENNLDYDLSIKEDFEYYDR